MDAAIALPEGWETGPLAEELKTYQEHLGELLRTASGKFVLIKGNEIVDLYDNQEEALNEGYRRYRLKSFMVQRVQRELETYYIGGSALLMEE
jgi:hypothetical protein